MKKMKRLLATILTLCFMYSLQAQYTLTDDDVVVSNGIIQSCSYDFSNTRIIIPETLDGQTVIGITDATSSSRGIFYNKGITNVQLPSTIQTIGKYAFCYNSIDTLDLSNYTNLTRISTNAFYSNQMDVLSLKNCTALDTLGVQCFHYNSIDTVDFTNCSALKLINKGAFYANDIKYVNLQSCNALKTIATDAFRDNKLDSVNITACNVLSKIGKNAFSSNTNLNSIILPECTVSGFQYWQDNKNNTYSGGTAVSAFDVTYWTYNPYTLTDADVVVNNGIIDSCFYDFSLSDIIIPQILDGQTVIGIADASSSNTGLFAYKSITSLVLPNTLQKIGKYAFYANEFFELNLKDFTALTSVGELAFYSGYISSLNLLGCNKLKNIDSHAFASNSIDTIDLSECTALQTISSRAFSHNPCDTLILNNPSLRNIGTYAFYSNYVSHVNLSSCDSLNSIGAYAFYNTNIESFALPSPAYTEFEYWLDKDGNHYTAGESVNNLSSGYRAVGYHTLSNDEVVVTNGIIDTCTYSFDLTDIIIPNQLDGQYVTGIADKDSKTNGVFSNKNITSIQLPDSLKTIGNYAFHGNSIKTLELNKCPKLERIKKYAFSECEIDSLNFTNCSELKYLGSFSFANNSIDSLNLEPCSMLDSINNHAFYRCNIDTLILDNPLLGYIGDYAFAYNIPGNIDLSSLTSLWFIGGAAFINTLDSFVLPTNNDPNFKGWRDYNGNVHTAGETVSNTAVAYQARIIYTLTDADVFVYNGSIDTCYYNFTSVDIIIPDSLDGQLITAIGRSDDRYEGVFYGKSIKSVVFPDSLKTIGAWAFNSNSFDTLNLSNLQALTTIDSNAFYRNFAKVISLANCSNLTNINYAAFRSSYATSINFSNCTKLKNIGHQAFQYHKSKTIDFSTCTGLHYIGSYALTSDSLTSFVLPTPADTTFLYWIDGSYNVYQANAAVNNFNAYYNAIIPYTLTRDDVVVTDGYITSCSYDFDSKAIIIPDTLNSQAVIGINDASNLYKGIFYNKGLVYLKLPSTLSYIGQYAFSNNKITELDISACAKLENIKAYAFQKSNIDSLNFSHLDSLINIGNYAFFDNNIDTLIFGNNNKLSNIGEYAFKSNSIKNIDLSACTSLTDIGTSAFIYNSLSYIILPEPAINGFEYWLNGSNAQYQPGDSITNFNSKYHAVIFYTLTDNDVVVENGSITSCSYNFAFTDIIIPETLDNQTVTAISGSNNQSEGVFYNKGITSLRLPSTLSKIGNYAFNTNNITELDLSGFENIKSIDKYAFYKNSSLNGVYFTNCSQLTQIDEYAFSSCSIDSISFVGCTSLKLINEGAFYKNTIYSMNLNECTALKQIKAEAFYNNKLSKVQISECSNLNLIGLNAFEGNNSLTYRGIKLPAPSQSDFEYWFDANGNHYAGGDTIFSTKNLYSAYIPYTLTDNDVEVINGYIVSCSYDFEYTNIIIPETLDGQTVTGIADAIDWKGVFNESPITSVKLPATLLYIGKSAFYNNEQLAIIDFSACTALNTIGLESFMYCFALKSIDLSGCSSLTKISDVAFYYCRGVEQLNLSGCSQLKHIGKSAFHSIPIDTLNLNSCPELATIGEEAFYYSPVDTVLINECNKLASIGKDAFYYGSLNDMLLPTSAYTEFGGWYDGDGNAYTNADTITNFRTYYYADVTYTLTDDDVVVVDGVIDTCLYDFTFKKIIIPETLDGQTVTGIANAGESYENGIFYYKELVSVTLPKSIENIGSYAFGLNNFTKLNLSAYNNLKLIGNSAFRNNYIDTVNLENCTSLEQIGSYAFYDNRTSLVHINFKGCNELKTISKNAFYYNQSLKKVDLNPCVNLTTIENEAFKYCNIDSVSMGSCAHLTFIGANAFANNTKLKAFTLPELSYTNFQGWFDGSGNEYNEGDSITDFSKRYYAKVPYTLTDDDVVVNDGVIESCSYDFVSKHITMPETLDGQTVTGILDVAESNNGIFANKNMVSMNLPSTITYLGHHAFSGNYIIDINVDSCSGLTHIGTYALSGIAKNKLDFNNFTSLTTIGYGAFYNANIDTVLLSNCSALEDIGIYAFYNNSIDTLSLENNTALKNIKYNAFLTNSINKLDLSTCTSLKSIGNAAFAGNSIDSINLSKCNLLTYIGQSAFGSNSGIYLGTLPTPDYDAFTGWKSGAGDDFAAGDSIYDTEPHYYAVIPYTLTDDDVVVTNGVIDTCTYDFTSKTIIIPETLDGQTVTGIKSAERSEKGVFAKNNICSVELPTTLISIGDYAFYFNSLVSVDIQYFTSLEYLGYYAYYSNSPYLKNITLPTPNKEGYLFKYWLKEYDNSELKGGAKVNMFYTSYSAIFEEAFTATFTVTHNTDAIEGATITIDGTNYVTNSSGESEIQLANGDYSFTVQADGYNDYSNSFTIAYENETINVSMSGVSVGTEEITKLIVYPNPAVSEVCIKSSETINSIQLISLSGQVIQSQIVNSNESKISVNDLHKGIYLLRINTNKESIIKRVCKQ